MLQCYNVARNRIKDFFTSKDIKEQVKHACNRSPFLTLTHIYSHVHKEQGTVTWMLCLRVYKHIYIVSGPLLLCIRNRRTVCQRQVMREKKVRDQVRSFLDGCSGPCLVTHSRPGGWGGRKGEDWSVRQQPVSPPSHWGRSQVPPRYADHSSYTARAQSPPGAEGAPPTDTAIL